MDLIVPPYLWDQNGEHGHKLRAYRELRSWKAIILSFNRDQSRAVTGLLMSHNTLRRHIHLLGLLDSPLCSRRGVEEETSSPHSL